MSLLAVTVLGHDRPAIIADVTAALAELGGNLEDSSMTLLRGHFAWMLVVDLEASAEEIEARLRFLADEHLVVSVLPLPDENRQEAVSTHLLTVRGADRPGIVSALTRVVAAHGGNVTDLSTRLAGGLYVLLAEVQFPDDVEIVALGGDLRAAADALGVGVSLRPAEADVL